MGPWIIGVGIFVACILAIRHERKVRDRIDNAFGLGRRLGHFEGWMSHAEGSPLQVMPPRLQEIEEAINVAQGWGTSFFDYPDTDELAQSGSCISWDQWQAQRLKDLNDKYLASNRKATTT